jgi:very-short-patch-repair endonuclease
MTKSGKCGRRTKWLLRRLPPLPPFEKGGPGGISVEVRRDFRGKPREFNVLAYDQRLKKAARRLRSEMTDAERHLWSKLRGKQILGVQFYRHRPIGCYIVDFFGPAAKLVIEVDGSQHFEPEQAHDDRVRTEFLREHGLRVLRFDNRQILLESDAVLNEIFEAVQSRLSRQNPP